MRRTCATRGPSSRRRFARRSASAKRADAACRSRTSRWTARAAGAPARRRSRSSTPPVRAASIVEADQYAYTAASSTLGIRFPSWALEGGQEKIDARLNDPATWAQDQDRDGSVCSPSEASRISSFAVVASYRADPSLNGLSMKQVAARSRARSTADAQFEAARQMMLAGGASMVYHFMSDEDVERIMKHPLVGVASDSSVADVRRGDAAPARLRQQRARARRVRARAARDHAGGSGPEDDVTPGASVPLRRTRAGQGRISRRPRRLRSCERSATPRHSRSRTPTRPASRTCSSTACSWSRTASTPARRRDRCCT